MTLTARSLAGSLLVLALLGGCSGEAGDGAAQEDRSASSGGDVRVEELSQSKCDTFGQLADAAFEPANMGSVAPADLAVYQLDGLSALCHVSLGHRQELSSTWTLANLSIEESDERYDGFSEEAASETGASGEAVEATEDGPWTFAYTSGGSASDDKLAVASWEKDGFRVVCNVTDLTIGAVDDEAALRAAWLETCRGVPDIFGW